MTAHPVTAILLAPVLAYRRWVSPALPARCRFTPSCSAYAEEALRTHGGLRGGWLALRRVARCHPFHAGGVDRVPSLPTCATTTRAARRTTGASL